MSPLKIHLDEDADSRALFNALLHRGLDVTSTGREGLSQCSDAQQLEWATRQRRCIYSYNAADFCKIHAETLRKGGHHPGVIIGDQQTTSIGEEMRRILKLCEAKGAEQMRDQLEFLSKWR